MAETGALLAAQGMVTAVGLNAKQTAASVRAGLDRFSETSIYNKRFDPLVMALLPDDVLPPLADELENENLTTRQSRMLRLAMPALQEATTLVDDRTAVPIYLGLPEPYDDRPAPVGPDFLQWLAAQSQINIDQAASKLFASGRAAGLEALRQAVADLVSGRHDCILAGGVDTYLDLYRLGALDMQDRLLAEGVMDAFIPGEGACFLLLASARKADSFGWQPLAEISPGAQAREPGHLYSDEPYRGEGLSATFEELFRETSGEQKVAEVFSAMNGENHWAKEWGIAFMRNQDAFAPDHGMQHPADCLGDTGAASGPLMAGLAATGIGRSHTRSPALITCSSDFGERAACLVTAN